MAKAKVLSKDEIKRVMRIANTGRNGIRDRVALSLSILAGMRIGEIAKLKISDVRDLDGNAVSVINLSRHQTKGNRSRRVFVSDELRKLLTSYLATISELDGSKALIRSTRTRSHFSNVSLSLRFKAIYLAAGISRCSSFQQLSRVSTGTCSVKRPRRARPSPSINAPSILTRTLTRRLLERIFTT